MTMKHPIPCCGAAASPSSTARSSTRKRKRTLFTALTTLLLAALLIVTPAPTAASSPSSSTYTPELENDPSAGFFPSESLTETLLLKPLPDGRVLASFDFSLVSTSNSVSSFRLLPRALLQPIQHFGVSEVHLALNSGRWRYSDWGSPVTVLKQRSGYAEARAHRETTSSNSKVKLGEESVATGAELLARFQGHDATDERWKGLTSALAGLFCTSLDALDERHTVQPHHAYKGDGSSGKTLHALLPTENVCTENLTPFLKLLPCKNRAGLATLLNPLALFGANFQGLGVHVKRLPSLGQRGGKEGEERGGWEVKLTFTAVFAPAVTRDVSVRDWSLRSLFGRAVDSACPLADRSVIRLLKPNDPEGGAKYQVEPLPPFPPCAKPGERGCGPAAESLFPVLEEQDEVTDELASAGLLAFETQAEQDEYDERLQRRWAHYLDQIDGEYLYDVPTMLSGQDGGAAQLDVRMSWPHETRFAYPAHNASGPTVQVERTLIGSGQERTRLQVVFTNTEARVAQRVLWYETLGYFVKPYLHTLSHDVQFLPPPSPPHSTDADATTLGREDEELLRGVADFANPVEEMVYQPTTSMRGSRKPFVIESVVRIPARSTVTLSLELRKEFVPYSQHPPDAHRGFDLSPAIVFPLAPVDPRQEALLAARRRAAAAAAGSKNGIAAATNRPGQSTLRASLMQLVQRYRRYAGDDGAAARRTASPTRPRELSKSQTRIYTLPRLVELATPDFSFVYTNIIFTSTVVALFFGSTLNTLLRTFADFVM